jgi:hypothetical protein
MEIRYRLCQEGVLKRYLRTYRICKEIATLFPSLPASGGIPAPHPAHPRLEAIPSAVTRPPYEGPPLNGYSFFKKALLFKKKTTTLASKKNNFYFFIKNKRVDARVVNGDGL